MGSMRMISALLLLQSRQRITAGELAAELEVSVATARRDLEALAMAGVPVYPQPGRGGGWSLVGGARTDLSGLTGPESQALFLLIGSASEGTPALQSAVRKLLRAIPGSFTDDAEAAAAAVRVDSAGWGGLERVRPPLVEVVQQAVIDRRQITIDYTNRAGEASTVTVSPLGMIDKADRWYLLATRDGQAVRTYRMDRVSAVETLVQAAQRPDDFDLAAEWLRVSELVERQRSLVTATVLVEQRHVPVLRSIFGRYLTELEDGVAASDGADSQLETSGGQRDADRHWVRVQVAAHTAGAVAEQLAGWGAMIEVVEPEAVRHHLARIGAELTERYPAAATPSDPGEAATPAGSSGSRPPAAGRSASRH